MASTPLTLPTLEANASSTAYHQTREEPLVHRRAAPFGNHFLPAVLCPLCWGQVSGWVDIESARRYMNTKARSCSCETCSFSGNYEDLRTHARLRHPFVRPSNVDPTRERDWRRLEHETNYRDILSITESGLDSYGIFLINLLDLFMELAVVDDTQFIFSLSDWDLPPRFRRDLRDWRSEDCHEERDQATLIHQRGCKWWIPLQHGGIATPLRGGTRVCQGNVIH